MKQIKRTIAGLSALVVMLSGGFGVVPQSAVDFGIVVSAEADYTEDTYEALTYRNYEDHIEIVGCDKSATSIIIPEYIEGYPVTVIGENAFSGCTKLYEIQIDPDRSELTAIERGAFENCEKLERFVVFTKIDKISADTFKGCRNLSYVFFEDSVKTIESGAFSGCEKLETIYYGGDEKSWNAMEINKEENDAFINADVQLGSNSITKIKDEGSIQILKFPNKTEYQIGEELDLTGGFFCGGYTTVYLGKTKHGDFVNADLAEYVDRGTLKLDDSEFDNTKPGTYMIHIKYYDDVDSFKVTVKEAAPTIPLGNLNGDDAINANDAAILLAAAAASGAGGDSGLTEEQIKAADLNADDNFDAIDAAIILQYAAYAGTGGKDSIQDFIKILQ